MQSWLSWFLKNAYKFKYLFKHYIKHSVCIKFVILLILIIKTPKSLQAIFPPPPPSWIVKIYPPSWVGLRIDLYRIICVWRFINYIMVHYNYIQGIIFLRAHTLFFLYLKINIWGSTFPDYNVWGGKRGGLSMLQ